MAWVEESIIIIIIGRSHRSIMQCFNWVPDNTRHDVLHGKVFGTRGGVGYGDRAAVLVFSRVQRINVPNDGDMSGVFELEDERCEL